MTKARRARLAAAVALAEKHLSEDNTPGAAFLHSQRVQELRAEEALLSASLKRLEAERSLATARHQCETELQTFRAGVAAREKAVAQMIAAGRAAKQQGRQPANASERPVLTLMECSELALDDEEALETREEGVTRERKRSVAVSSAAASETASEESDSGSCNNSISNRGAVDRGGLGSSSSSSSSSSITPSSRSMGTAAAASHSITTSSPLEPQPLGLSATYDADEAVLLTSPASPPVARRRARPTASKQQHPRRSKNRKRRSASVSASGGRERRRNKGVGAATSTTMMSHRRSSAQRKRRATAPKSSSTLAKRLSPQRLQQQQQQQRRRRGGGGGGKKLLGRLRHRLRARSSSNTVTQGARIKKTHSAKTKKSRPKAIASGSRRGMTRMSTKRLASHTTSKRLLQRIKTQLSRYSNQNAVEVLKRTRKSAWRRSLANGTPRRR